MEVEPGGLTRLTSQLSGSGEEFALHPLYRELELLSSGRGFRLLKGESRRV